MTDNLMLLILDHARKHPPATTFGDFVEAMDRFVEHGECRWCDGPISATKVGDRVWFHDDPARSRGCRAASFDDDDGWDDSLSRDKKATPKDAA